MALVAASPAPVRGGATLVRSGPTKAQRLAEALGATGPAGVYGAGGGSRPAAPAVGAAGDGWAYVGTASYNALLERALKRAGARRRGGHTSAPVAPGAQRPAEAPTFVGERQLTRRGSDGKRAVASATPDRRVGVEHAGGGCRVGAGAKRSRTLRGVPGHRFASYVETTPGRHDLPLRQWELATVDDAEASLVRRNQGEEYCGMRGKVEDLMLLDVSRDAAGDREGEDELETSAQHQVGGWAEPKTQGPPEVMGRSTDVPVSSLNTVDTVSVAPAMELDANSGTWKGEGSPSQTPVARQVEVERQAEKRGDRRKKEKKQGHSGVRSTLNSLQFDTISKFYVVNASSDWTFD
ncbi:uncharacterized protein BcabD6B2_40890 [Babesia caballi]|uniref:Uncharacterized protein n=1 Tax=Babesia caballi TaxID=5871 RepID=A0AAV4LY17_BABCB|nr:hypothetical protein, conserved [Babesia caballi]